MANVEDPYLAFVRGDRLELPDPRELAEIRTLVLEGIAVDDLHGTECAEGAARQPDLAVGSAPDAAQHFVIGITTGGSRDGMGVVIAS